MGLLGVDELAALSEVAESLFNSRVEIFHQAISEASDAWDDSTETPIADAAEPTAVVDGWLRNQPDYQTSDALGALAHEEDGRLFVPLGTELARQDKVVVYARDADGNPTGDGTTYRVIDTNTENTHRVLIRASLRRMA